MENNHNLKDLFLAAVGGTAMTYDRAQEVVDQMIERGKVSVKEGKELTEDLKRTIKREPSGVAEDVNADTRLMEEIIGLRKDINDLSQRVEALEAQDQDNVTL